MALLAAIPLPPLPLEDDHLAVVAADDGVEGGVEDVPGESGHDRLGAPEVAYAFSRSEERIDLSSDDSERRFIAAAKLEMARQRQKLMALMVMLGINRIIVTNGRINAKVVFDIRASDYAQRQASAAMQDRREKESMGVMTAALPWGAAGGYSK
jgi:hypothetical protein